jgi:Ca2+-binding EF-hand superfamily protein
VFDEFDTDKSGLIEFDEFEAMLPQLGITMT